MPLIMFKLRYQHVSNQLTEAQVGGSSCRTITAAATVAATVNSMNPTLEQRHSMSPAARPTTKRRYLKPTLCKEASMLGLTTQAQSVLRTAPRTSPAAAGAYSDRRGATALLLAAAGMLQGRWMWQCMAAIRRACPCILPCCSRARDWSPCCSGFAV